MPLDLVQNTSLGVALATPASALGSGSPVTTYAATPIGKFKPKAHYLEWVMKGLTHWKLPEEAIETWKSYTPK